MKESMKWVLQHFPDSDAEEVICDTQKMIQAKSYNPPGDETRVAEFAGKRLREAGFDVEVDEFEKNRCNVIATYGIKMT